MNISDYKSQYIIYTLWKISISCRFLKVPRRCQIVVTSNFVHIWSLDSGGIIFFRATDFPEWEVSDAWFWLLLHPERSQLSKRCYSFDGSTAIEVVWEPEKSFSFPSHDINHSTKLLLSLRGCARKFSAKKIQGKFYWLHLQYYSLSERSELHIPNWALGHISETF